MGASNWAVCPRCADQHAVRLDAMRSNVRAAYGNVTVEQFDQLRMDLALAETAKTEQTLREDYEIYGAEDGTVVAEYGNVCTKCGLTTQFTYRHEMDI